MAETKVTFIGGEELAVECDARILANRLDSSNTVAMTKADSDEVIVYVRRDAVAYVEEVKKREGPLAFAHR